MGNGTGTPNIAPPVPPLRLGPTEQAAGTLFALVPSRASFESPTLRRLSRQFKRVAQGITFVCRCTELARQVGEPKQHKNRRNRLSQPEHCALWTDWRDSAGPSLPINSAIGSLSFHPGTCGLFTNFSGPAAAVFRPHPHSAPDVRLDRSGLAWPGRLGEDLNRCPPGPEPDSGIY